MLNNTTQMPRTVHASVQIWGDLWRSYSQQCPPETQARADLDQILDEPIWIVLGRLMLQMNEWLEET